MTEQWCGCDGEGMAHKPGSVGFECEFNCPGHKNAAWAWPRATKHYICGPVRDKIAALKASLAQKEAEVANLKQNRRIVETVDALVGPESAKLVEATLIAVDRAEKAEALLAELRRVAGLMVRVLETTAKCYHGNNGLPCPADCLSIVANAILAASRKLCDSPTVGVAEKKGPC